MDDTMITFKWFIIISILSMSAHASAATVAGTAQVQITGQINGANVCTISISGDSVLVAGENKIADLLSIGGDISSIKEFSTAVACSFPTAIIIKYTSALPTHTTKPLQLGIYKTSTDKHAAYLAADIGISKPTVGLVPYSYAPVGDQTFSSITAETIFSAAPDNSGISGIALHAYNAFTVIGTNNKPVLGTAFTLPFRLAVISNPKTDQWHLDIVGLSLSLATSVTVELITI